MVIFSIHNIMAKENLLKKNHLFCNFLKIVMKGNTILENVMVMENKLMNIKILMKDNGKMTKKFKKENFNFLIILVMKVKFKMKKDLFKGEPIEKAL